MIRVLTLLNILFLLGTYKLSGEDFQYYPTGVSYDPKIPTLEDVVGHRWGERISSVDEIETYLQELAQSSSKVALVPYAASWEERTLSYLILTSGENMTRLEEIKRGIEQLAFPSQESKEVNTLLKSLPATVWLLYGVHGNEISSPDAALLTAYHLAGAQDNDLVRKVLSNCVVIIDPLQNPDGRNRFVSYLQQTQGRWPDEDSQAAEHDEVWPTGRPNHYLFDMNRDWFARTQPETRGRINTYLEWYPQIVVDFHEMGGDSTYFFGPPAKPFNPELTDAQLKWLNRLGRNNARWFDSMNFDYFTQEVFDSFYPGYGEDWPMFHGSIGMTYEQASSRGLAFLRKDETTLHFRQSVQHHFIASLATLESAAENRRELLEYFYNYRSSALEGNHGDSIKEFILIPGSDPNRVSKLAGNLVAQGVEVRIAEAPFQNKKVFNYYDPVRRKVEFPRGAYLIPTSQPGGRLARTLLGQHAPIDREFLEVQKSRLEKRLEQHFYDLTGWSLPLLFDVDCYVTESPSRVRTTQMGKDVLLQGGLKGGRSHVAYVIPWGTNSAAQILTALLRQKIRVHSSDKPFKKGEVEYPRGSLIIKVKDNPEDLHERLAILATELGVDVYSTESSWVEAGINFGSRQVHFLKRPEVAMAYNIPTDSESVGATRFLLEQSYGYPVTVIHTYRLGDADLSRYDVLILPDDAGESLGYSELMGAEGISQLREWVNRGGTLITLGGASKWLTEKEVGLLATTTEKKTRQETSGEKDDQRAEELPDEEPDADLPVRTPGAILRVSLDEEHWLTAGYDSDTNVLVSSRRVFSLLKLDKGRNLAVYSPEENLLLSGFMWEEAKKQLAGKAYLMHQELGTGNVIAFAEDPNFRAFVEGLNLLFMNAVFFGPSH